jgi:hypothetical protein
MKLRFKKFFFLFLILLLTLALVACAPSMSSIEQRLEELEMDDELSYQRTPKNKREELAEQLEDDYDAKIEGAIVKIYVADQYNEDRTDYKNVTVIEFEKSSDAKEAAKAFDIAAAVDKLGENTVVIRKGKLVFLGSQELIDLILD